MGTEAAHHPLVNLVKRGKTPEAPMNLVSTTKNAAIAAFLHFVLLSSSVLAATAMVSAQVNQVLISADDTYGGCMAALSSNPQDLLPACLADWVSFSCSGHFTDAARGFRMLDQAQLALATNKRVTVVVDDTRRHNGYCFAWRIDVIR
jgi:hypothetical protein